MDTDIFSNFDQGGDDNAGGSFDFRAPGTIDEGVQPQAAVEEPTQDPVTSPDPATTPDPQATSDSVTIKREEWDNTQRMLSEFKGFMAAQQNRASSPAQATPQPDQNALAAQQQQAAARAEQALRARLKSVGERMLTEPDAALEEFLLINQQIADARAQQYAQQFSAPAATSAVDLMIENFITRKSAKDPLYEKIAERFENKLKQYDTRALANYSRQQLNEALEEVYDAEAGRWAREQYLQAQSKRTTTRQDPTNYGGGRSAGGASGGDGTRNMAIPEAWKTFAKSAGIPESEITPELFKDLVK